ncbi:hypothetical protein [Leucobacter sp. GX24907]
MTGQQTAKRSLLRRIGRTLVNEFAAPPKPRPTPSDKDFAEGREAIGIIRSAVPNDSPEGGQLDDDLIIAVHTSDNDQPLTLPRTFMCPLPGAGAGQGLIGQQVAVRHTTVDPDYDNDILVTRWPTHVAEALKPIRYEGPGAFRARIWAILSGYFFVIGTAGVMLTPILLCNLIFGALTETNMLADILPGLHPAIAVAVSIGVIPSGIFLGCVCLTRRDRLREGMTVKGQ